MALQVEIARAFVRLEADFGKLKQSLDRVEADVSRASARMQSSFAKIGSNIQGAILGLVSVGTIKAVINTFHDYERAVGELADVLNLPVARMGAFKIAIRELSDELGLAQSKLLDFATVAVQLGARTPEQVRALTEDIGKLAISIDGFDRSLLITLGRTALLFGLTTKEIKGLGSALGAIAEAPGTLTTVRELADGMERFGILAQRMNLSLAQSGAIIATLTSSGMVATRAVLALEGAFQRMFEATIPFGDTKVSPLAVMASDLGMTVQAIEALFAANPIGLFIAYERQLIKTADVQTRLKRETELFGEAGARVIFALANSYDTKFLPSLKAVQHELKTTANVNDDFARRAQSNWGQVEMAWTSFANSIIRLGELIAPVLRVILNILTSFVRMPEDIIRAAGRLGKATKELTDDQAKALRFQEKVAKFGLRLSPEQLGPPAPIGPPAPSPEAFALPDLKMEAILAPVGEEAAKAAQVLKKQEEDQAKIRDAAMRGESAKLKKMRIQLMLQDRIERRLEDAARREPAKLERMRMQLMLQDRIEQRLEEQRQIAAQRIAAAAASISNLSIALLGPFHAFIAKGLDKATASLTALTDEQLIGLEVFTKLLARSENFQVVLDGLNVIIQDVADVFGLLLKPLADFFRWLTGAEAKSAGIRGGAVNVPPGLKLARLGFEAAAPGGGAGAREAAATATGGVIASLEDFARALTRAGLGLVGLDMVLRKLPIIGDIWESAKKKIGDWTVDMLAKMALTFGSPGVAGTLLGGLSTLSIAIGAVVAALLAVENILKPILDGLRKILEDLGILGKFEPPKLVDPLIAKLEERLAAGKTTLPPDLSTLVRGTLTGLLKGDITKEMKPGIQTLLDVLGKFQLEHTLDVLMEQLRKRLEAIPSAQMGGAIAKGGLVNLHPGEVVSPARTATTIYWNGNLVIEGEDAGTLLEIIRRNNLKRHGVAYAGAMLG